MFRKVKKTDESALNYIATQILEPLYGNQDKALEGWLYGKYFKKAFVPIIDNSIAGLISLKVVKDKSYLKISTLLVLPDHQGKGLGKKMLKFVETFALNNGYHSIKVTVSDEKQESLLFFKKHGFVVKDVITGKYKPGINENILFKNISS